MKKRFLITVLAICFCGALVSCKPKEKPEEKSKDNSQVNVKEKKVKENTKEDNSEKKPEEKPKEKPEEKKEEKGLNFIAKDLRNNDVKKVVSKGDKMSFDIYTVGMNFTIKLDGKEYSAEDAISKGIFDEDKLIEKLEKDKEDKKCTTEMYRDSGTIIYRYKDYSIVKYNSDDDNENMYITKEKDLESLEKILNKN